MEPGTNGLEEPDLHAVPQWIACRPGADPEVQPEDGGDRPEVAMRNAGQLEPFDPAKEHPGNARSARDRRLGQPERNARRSQVCDELLELPRDPTSGGGCGIGSGGHAAIMRIVAYRWLNPRGQ